MFKMFKGVATLFFASLVGLACSSHTSLNPGGATTVGGATSGGQVAGGVVGSTGGSVVSGGMAGGSGGTIAAGGSGGTIAAGGSGGSGSCTPHLCIAPPCAGKFVPSSEPCACPVCDPFPDAGTARDAGSDSPGCLALPCAPPLCPAGWQVQDSDPCACPVCVPTPDAGIGKDASPDSLVCPGPIPPCVPPPETCPAGTQLSSPPCRCTGCFPVDGGTVDSGEPDGRVICDMVCLDIFCMYGELPNSKPCSCPVCAPPPDAGVVKDASRADTSPIACPMLAALNSTDAARISYSAGRALVSCAYASGATGICVSDDVTTCSSSAVGEPLSCSNLCAANQYGLSYGGVGPLAAPPSIELPAGCTAGSQTPAGVAFYCCPCGS
jgi:hypothetical protein